MDFISSLSGKQGSLVTLSQVIPLKSKPVALEKLWKLLFFLFFFSFLMHRIIRQRLKLSIEGMLKHTLLIGWKKKLSRVFHLSWYVWKTEMITFDLTITFPTSFSSWGNWWTAIHLGNCVSHPGKKGFSVGLLLYGVEYDLLLLLLIEISLDFYNPCQPWVSQVFLCTW